MYEYINNWQHHVKITLASDWKIRIKCDNKDIADIAYECVKDIKTPNVSMRGEYKISSTRDRLMLKWWSNSNKRKYRFSVDVIKLRDHMKILYTNII